MPKALVRRHRRADWRRLRRLPRYQTPRHWRDWVLDSGSLTRRLLHIGADTFHVEVLFEGWCRPTRAEAQQLQLDASGWAWVREVALCCLGAPVVLARSVIPRTTARGRQRRLLHLGNQPLGAYLFACKGMRRAPLQTVCMDEAAPTRCYGRSSLFYLDDKPLLVCEVFLPHITQVTARITRDRRQAA